MSQEDDGAGRFLMSRGVDEGGSVPGGQWALHGLGLLPRGLRGDAAWIQLHRGPAQRRLRGLRGKRSLRLGLRAEEEDEDDTAIHPRRWNSQT